MYHKGRGWLLFRKALTIYICSHKDADASSLSTALASFVSDNCTSSEVNNTPWRFLFMPEEVNRAPSRRRRRPALVSSVCNIPYVIPRILTLLLPRLVCRVEGARLNVTAIYLAIIAFAPSTRRVPTSTRRHRHYTMIKDCLARLSSANH